MSQPKRYAIDSDGVPYPLDTGDYVRHSDHEAATKATFEAIRTITQLRDDYAALAAENANLKALQWETLKERNKAEAENERLRKAGDAMADDLECMSENDLCFNSLEDWNAAKEGRDAK